MNVMPWTWTSGQLTLTQVGGVELYVLQPDCTLFVGARAQVASSISVRGACYALGALVCIVCKRVGINTAYLQLPEFEECMKSVNDRS